MKVLKFYFIELAVMILSVLLPAFYESDSSLINTILFPGLLVAAFIVGALRFIFESSKS